MPKGLLIFMIDDDTDDQEVFSQTMGKVVPLAKCEFADDGVHALQKLRSPDPSFLPDLIFIDINMPRMNGIECLAEIKKLTHLIDVPAYMYSTSDESFIVAKSLSAGAVGFVKKEVHPKELENRLQKILKDHQFSTHQ
jgi:CheY-like chemotaxis protein